MTHAIAYATATGILDIYPDGMVVRRPASGGLTPGEVPNWEDTIAGVIPADITPGVPGTCGCEHDEHFDTDAMGKPKPMSGHAYGDGVADGPEVPFIGRICQTCSIHGHAFF